VNVVAQL